MKIDLNKDPNLLTPYGFAWGGYHGRRCADCYDVIMNSFKDAYRCRRCAEERYLEALKRQIKEQSEELTDPLPASLDEQIKSLHEDIEKTLDSLHEKERQLSALLKKKAEEDSK